VVLALQVETCRYKQVQEAAALEVILTCYREPVQQQHLEQYL
jgi:hypothetical protein